MKKHNGVHLDAHWVNITKLAFFVMYVHLRAKTFCAQTQTQKVKPKSTTHGHSADMN